MQDLDSISRFGRLYSSSPSGLPLVIQATLLSPTTYLLDKLYSVIQIMHRADPELLVNRGLLARLMRSNVKAKESFSCSSRQIELQLQEACAIADRVHALIQQISHTIRQSDVEIEFLEAHLRFGEDYLKEPKNQRFPSIKKIPIGAEQALRSRLQEISESLKIKMITVEKLRELRSRAEKVMIQFCEVRDKLAPAWKFNVDIVNVAHCSDRAQLLQAKNSYQALLQGLIDVTEANAQFAT